MIVAVVLHGPPRNVIVSYAAARFDVRIGTDINGVLLRPGPVPPCKHPDFTPGLRADKAIPRGDNP